MKVNQPAQHDDYNCGLFAFAYIWCSVYGWNFCRCQSTATTCVSLLFTLC